MTLFDFPPDTAIGRLDALRRFQVLAEHFDLTADLLTGDGEAEHRMGLVLADQMAETLLVAHTEWRFQASEVPFWRYGGGRSYSTRQRARIRRNFAERVHLATRAFDDLPPGEPILADEDAVVFLIAHRYRNAVYHRDRHHPALIGWLGRVYLRAVGQAFIRAQPKGVSGGGVSADVLTPFARFGWSVEEIARGRLNWREAAERIVQRRFADLEVELGSLRSELIADVRERCDLVDRELDKLRADNLPEEMLASMLFGAQAWAANRSDPQLLELEDERYALTATLINEDRGPTEPELTRYADLQAAAEGRMEELKAAFVAPLDLRSVAELRDRTGALEPVRSIRDLLIAYEPIDEQLDLAENSVGWVAREWDRLVQQRIDEIRGK
jgi:hypothetical protein